MKILLLTSINPVIAGDLYNQISQTYPLEERNFKILCFPYFAYIQSRKDDQYYIPTYFSMLKASRENETHKKLYNERNILVIGNTYKSEKFDMIIAFNPRDEEVFDKYIKTIKEQEDFSKSTKVNELYNPMDSDIILPTIQHVITFLEGVYKDDKDKIQ
ncbi:MAG: hypothetical protein ACOCUD_04235 [Bacillota bacterium]